MKDSVSSQRDCETKPLLPWLVRWWETVPMFQIQSPEPPWRRPVGVVNGERMRYSREALRY